MTHCAYPLTPGILEVYCGPMKCGKTAELFYKIDKIIYMKNCPFSIFGPMINVRDTELKSRLFKTSHKIHLIDEKTPGKILDSIRYERLVLIDEVQFFAPGIEKVIEELQRKDIHVVVSGLDLDFRGEPFGQMPVLLARANVVHKLSGICDYLMCNQPSTRTQRLIDGKPAPYNSPLISIDGSNQTEKYETRCLRHHIVPGKP